MAMPQHSFEYSCFCCQGCVYNSVVTMFTGSLTARFTPALASAASYMTLQHAHDVLGQNILGFPFLNPDSQVVLLVDLSALCCLQVVVVTMVTKQVAVAEVSAAIKSAAAVMMTGGVAMTHMVMVTTVAAGGSTVDHQTMTMLRHLALELAGKCLCILNWLTDPMVDW